MFWVKIYSHITMWVLGLVCAQLNIWLLCLLSNLALIILTYPKNIFVSEFLIFPHVNSVIFV